MQDLYTYGKGGTIPINPQPHLGRNSLNNMLRIVFGTRTDTIDHPLVARALMISREFMFVHSITKTTIWFTNALVGIALDRFPI